MSTQVKITRPDSKVMPIYFMVNGRTYELHNRVQGFWVLTDQTPGVEGEKRFVARWRSRKEYWSMIGEAFATALVTAVGDNPFGGDVAGESASETLIDDATGAADATA